MTFEVAEHPANGGDGDWATVCELICPSKTDQRHALLAWRFLCTHFERKPGILGDGFGRNVCVRFGFGLFVSRGDAKCGEIIFGVALVGVALQRDGFALLEHAVFALGLFHKIRHYFSISAMASATIWSSVPVVITSCTASVAVFQRPWCICAC